MKQTNTCSFIPEMNFQNSVWQWSFRCNSICSCVSWNKVNCVYHKIVSEWEFKDEVF